MLIHGSRQAYPGRHYYFWGVSMDLQGEIAALMMDSANKSEPVSHRVKNCLLAVIVVACMVASAFAITPDN